MRVNDESSRAGSYFTGPEGYKEISGGYMREIYSEKCAWSVEFLNSFGNWSNAYPNTVHTIEYAIHKVRVQGVYHHPMERTDTMRLRNIHTGEVIPWEVLCE